MNILLVTPTSVSAELKNKDCYYTGPYDIFLNDMPMGTENRNAFSLHGLQPDTEYRLTVAMTPERDTLPKTGVLSCTNSVTGDSQEVSSDNVSLKKTVVFRTLPLRERTYRSESVGGVCNDTEGLQNAIDNLGEDEFLTIDGIYKVTSLFLKDNLVLHLPKGSGLIGETDRTLFPILSADENRNGVVLGTWEGYADDSFASILTGIGVKNVCIYGEGVIDCNAQNSDWWVNHRVKRIARRPKGIFLHTCENVALEGITVCNTPSWNQHPFHCKNLKYINMNLQNPPNSPTTDGIDPESCDNVLIVGTRISVGDDCIAIKSGKLDFARKYRTPCSQVTVRNCLMEHGHAGVTIGSENSGGVRDVLVTNCLFHMTDRGLRIKSQRGRGNLAVIENITFRNVHMDDVKSPFVINAFYKAGTDEIDERFIREPLPITDLTPVFKDFTMEDILCENVSYGVGFFLGLPESMLKKVTLKNITVSYKPDAEAGEMAMTAWKEVFRHVGFVCENLEELYLEQVTFLEEPERKFILKNINLVKEIS